MDQLTTEQNFSVRGIDATIHTGEMATLYATTRVTDGSYGVIFEQDHMEHAPFWPCKSKKEAISMVAIIKHEIATSAGILLKPTGISGQFAVTDIHDIIPLL